MTDLASRHAAMIGKMRSLIGENAHLGLIHEAVALAQTLLHDTLGDRHPLMTTLKSFVEKPDFSKGQGTCRTIITLYEQGALISPRLQIAKELEEDVIDVAERQWREADKEQDAAAKQLRLAVAAFLCGAALEDALRRLCDKHGQPYDAGNTSLAKLQAALYSPSNGVEIISKSENAQIAAWGQTRNNADHGKFSLVTGAEVHAMIDGGRSLIERHLP